MQTMMKRETGREQLLCDVIESLPLNARVRQWLRPKGEGGMIGGNIKGWWYTRTVGEMIDKLEDKGFLNEADALILAAAGYKQQISVEGWMAPVDFSEI